MTDRNQIRRSTLQGGSALSAILPLVVGALVVAAAIYSFSPRIYLPDVPTRVRADGLLVTGMARQGDHFLAVGEQGHVLRTKTPEEAWDIAMVEPHRLSNLVSIEVIDDQNAVAVGHDSWIVVSSDGGKTWKETHFDPERSEPLLSVSGPFDGRLFAVGGFGQFLVSDDAGQSWSRESHDALGDYHLNDIVELADGRLILAAERGLMAVSEDAGRNWTKLDDIYPGSFFGALPLGDSGALVFGMRGNAFYSTDLKEWTQCEVPGKLSLFGGAIDEDGSYILVADDDTVLRSSDGGKSFSHAASEGRQRLVSVLPLEGERWLVAGEAGIRILKPAAAASKGDAS